jgi:copper chaperone CopZ
MKSITFDIPNISCGHCVHTIQTELSELAGVSKVAASEADRKVSIEYGDPATKESIVALLEEINYPPASG